MLNQSVSMIIIDRGPSVRNLQLDWSEGEPVVCLNFILISYNGVSATDERVEREATTLSAHELQYASAQN